MYRDLGWTSVLQQNEQTLVKTTRRNLKFKFAISYLKPHLAKQYVAHCNKETLPLTLLASRFCQMMLFADTDKEPNPLDVVLLVLSVLP